MCALIDWFDPQQRGVASACAAVGQVGGAVAASVVAVFGGSGTVELTGAAVVLLLVLGVPAVGAWLPVNSSTAIIVADPPHPPAQVGASTPTYRDARLAWFVRAVMTFSNTLVITFVNYFARDALQVSNPQRFVGTVAGVTALFVLLGAVWSGRASDRSGRRRSYVVIATVVMSIGEVVLGGLQHPIIAVMSCAVIGYGYGIYLAVDQALTVEVLPKARSYGRDLGVLNASTTVPQVAAPVAAAVLLGLSSSYVVLFAAGAVITLAAAPLVSAIRRVP